MARFPVFLRKALATVAFFLVLSQLGHERPFAGPSSNVAERQPYFRHFFSSKRGAPWAKAAKTYAADVVTAIQTAETDASAIRDALREIEQRRRWRQVALVFAGSGFTIWIATVVAAIAAWRKRRRILIVASSVAAAGLVGTALMKRFKLKGLSGEDIAFSLISAFVDEQTAAMFSKLPATMDCLKDAFGSDRLQLPAGEMAPTGTGSTSASRLAAIKRLITLSTSSSRKPYEEARKEEAAGGDAEGTSRPIGVEPLVEGGRLLVYAESTYEEQSIARLACEQRGYDTIFYQESAKPGEPAHFLCYNLKRREAILSIRGTKTPADVLTDVVAEIVETAVEGTELTLKAHSGILSAARFVLDRSVPSLRDLLAPLGFRLIVTGHSLGAGTASIVTFMLEGVSKTWPQPLDVRCIAFAPPPVMDEVSAFRCRAPPRLACAGAASEVPLPASEDELPLVQSFVCNDDMIPRVSMRNFAALAAIAQGADILEAAKASRGIAGSDDNLRRGDLTVPGQVIVLHREDTKALLPANGEKAAEKTGDAEQENAAASKSPDEWSAVVGDGSMLELNYLELAPRSIADHMAPVYREALAVTAVAEGGTPEATPRAQEDFPEWLQRAAEEAAAQAEGQGQPATAPAAAAESDAS